MVWLCTYYPFYERDALKVLSTIASGQGIVSGVAKTTIEEWKNGNLKNI